MEFSKEQKKAINHKNGPCLVLAVPGSGKTTVLLARINKLVESGVDPSKILAMTFSKSQALDMQDRYEKVYGDKSVKFSTIHSFSYGLVRSFSNHANKIELIEASKKYNKYQIVSQIFYQIKKRKISDEELDEFFRVSGYIKNTLMDYESYKKKYGQVFFNFEKVYIAYENFKKKNHLIDFDDMLLEALYILQNNKYALDFIQNKFDYIQIDEGQDTSFVQLKIISLIAGKKNNLFIVADDDQSIYGFRGASSELLLDFPKVYPDAKIYYMEDNYRSKENITTLANKLISNNKKRYKKSIKPKKDEGSKVNIKKHKTTNHQIDYVMKQALEDIKKDESVAILYRNNISSINLINRLNQNIDFYIKDSKYAFYMHPIIKDLINIIKFSKDTYDIDTFEKIYYKLNLYIKRDFVNQVKMMPTNQDIIENLKEVDGMNNFFLNNVYDLGYYMDKLSDLDFDEAIKYILFNMDYYEYLKEFSKAKAASMVSYDRIIDTLLNISEGVKSIVEFENKINNLIKKQKSKSITNSPLTLSTIHGSKGLEFDNVYLIDLVENEFPSSYAKASDEDDKQLEEERRLFYVGLTRAKNKLSLHYPESLYLNKVDKSSFINEI